MSNTPRISKGRAPSTARRMRDGNRTQVACINCKERKLKCDNQVPACDHCRRFGFSCLVEDPVTKRHQPRNYLELLENRVGVLENLLKEVRPDLAYDHLVQNGHQGHDTKPDSSTAEAVSSQHDGRSVPSGTGTGGDGLNDLASQVGMLSMNAAGAEPHYLGSSSAFAFSRLIAPSLRQVVLKHDGNPGSSSSQREDPTSRLIPCLLPDYPTAVMLSNAYFDNIHSQYPFLHEPTFRSWEAKLDDSSECFDPLASNYIPLFFLNIVYAVGSLLLPNCGCSAERFYMSAQLYVEEILQLDSLETVQAILSCAVYSLRSSVGTSHWKLSGLALRQCIDLGYHRCVKNLRTKIKSPLVTELRKRVFWCAYAMECKAAIMLGRPLGIPSQEIDVEYPMDIDDMDLTNEYTYGTPQTPIADRPTNMTRAIHTFRIRRIWGNIHTFLYSDVTRKVPANHLLHTEYLRAEIENWRSTIPPLKVPSGSPLSLFLTADCFEMDYNYSIMQLYRLQIIHDISGTTDSVFVECMQAAASTCHCFRRQFSKKAITYTWAALYELFLGGLTYLHCLWTSQAARASTQQHLVSNTCTDCTIVLVIMAERWEAAAPYRDIFEELSRHTISMMAESGPKDSQLASATPQIASTPNLIMANWMDSITDEGMVDRYDDFLSTWTGDSLPGEQSYDGSRSWTDT